MVQWRRLHVPNAGTWVLSLVCGATEPLSHNYRSPCALGPMSRNYGGLQALETVLHNCRRGHCNEKPMHRNEKWPLLAATRENLCKAAKTQSIQKQ